LPFLDVTEEKKDHEAEFALSRHGYAYLTGLSDPICICKTAIVFKIPGRSRDREFIGSQPRHARQISIRKMIDNQKKAN
jgi:hypothetical protein